VKQVNANLASMGAQLQNARLKTCAQAFA